MRLCRPSAGFVLIVAVQLSTSTVHAEPQSGGTVAEQAPREQIPQDVQVCVPVESRDDGSLARDVGYPIVQCIIMDRTTNQNDRRANADRKAVLAKTYPSETAAALDNNQTHHESTEVDMTWLRDPRVELPFDLDSLDGMSEVARYVQFYITEGRGRISTYFARSGRYAEQILQEIERQKAPKDLLWVVAIESNFDPEAVSPVGAMGLWQFMVRTAVSLDMRVDAEVDERRDPIVSTEKGIAYLLMQQRRFGTWPLALAAYNAGSGHVRGQIATWGVTELDALERYGAVYQSARSYAAKIMAIALIDRNRDYFGFDALVPDEAITWDVVHIQSPVRLSLIANAAGVPVDDVLELNPELVGKVVPKGGWDVRLPSGTYESFVHSYDRIAERYGEEHESVVLRFGETPEMIAHQYDIPERVLRAVNGYSRRDNVPYGTTLIVPQSSRKSTQKITPPQDEKITVVVPPQEYTYADRKRVFYRVHTMDSLQQIAAFFDVSLYELAAWNELSANSKIWQGMILQIYTPKALDESQAVYLDESQVQVLRAGSEEWDAWREEKQKRAVVASRRRQYTVKSGDTVSGIAKRHNVQPSDIIRWNNLKNANQIVIGQKLYVSGR